MAKTLISVRETIVNMEVIAITGSPKTRNLRYAAGVIVGYASRPVGTGSHFVRDAIVELADGEQVQTHRLQTV